MPVALVLGATGFLGGHIARSALRRGWTVRGLRRRVGSVGELAGEAIEWRAGDLDRSGDFEAAFRGADVVFHAAGFYPLGEIRVRDAVRRGREQTQRVRQAVSSAGVPRWVYTSSLTTIARPPEGEARLADERDIYQPGAYGHSPYYESKAAMESEALRPADGDSPAVVVIPTVVFGPGDVHMTVAQYLLAAARGAWISVAAQINVVDVRDVAEAQVAAAERGRPGERYLLGGENISISGLLRRVAQISGRPPPKVELPMRWVEGLARVAGRVPGLGMLNNHLAATGAWQPLDSGKARRELVWSTRALEETLRESLEWLEAHGHRWRR